MKNLIRLSIVVGIFVFGFALGGVTGDGFTSQTHFPATPLACGWEYVQIERRTDGHLTYRLMPRRKPGLGSFNTDQAWEASCFAREAYLQSLKNAELLGQILKIQTGEVKGQPNALAEDFLKRSQLNLWMK